MRHYAFRMSEGLGVSLALDMFAVAPALGKAGLSATQQSLLVGKARWIHLAVEAGLPVVPTIALTRAAWEGLQAERSDGDGRLRLHWVATLFRLVSRNGRPPALVVRTSAPAHRAGLMPAKTGIAPPASQADAVDPKKPLGRAIAEAFASYGPAEPGQIVIVQALAAGPLLTFHTRDPETGARGPALPQGGDLPAHAARLVDALDGEGPVLAVLLSGKEDGARFLSARPVPAASAARMRAAVERAESDRWSRQQAVAAIDPHDFQHMLHPRLKTSDSRPMATGLGVSPGAASGLIVFTAEDAARWKARGRHCILVVTETGPNDIQGMKAASGILTARGGMTSHAAVVARITGKPCVASVRSLSVDLQDMTCRIGDRIFHQGDQLTIDGTDGSVYFGHLPLEQPHMGGAMQRLLDWSDETRHVAVRANAETVEALQTAQSFGAEGIGLARSEHMFFSPERMVALRRLILSEDEDDRAAALTGLVDFQTGDYSDIFAGMAGRPVTIRLFDPPLHEFLPRTDEDIDETAQSLGLATRALRLRLDRIAEVNPMLGHRGVRLAITYPEILEMQMQALLAGAREAARRTDEPVMLEVMVPFVSLAAEVLWMRDRIMKIVDAAELPAEARRRFSFGTMIELPRACLRAGDIAHAVDFFSFGTNDLTQTTFGISRDDAPAFLAAYQRKGVYEIDPFVTLDQRGVGEIISIAIERGKAANPNLKIGICGEHAGDPASLHFLAGLPIDYVSCSPFRVPVARLALAQARNN